MGLREASEERRDRRGGSGPRAFLSVAELAREVGTSEMTLYRAIHAGEFPAVRIRGRIIVPRAVIEAMTAAAMTSGEMVDAADWVRAGSLAEDSPPGGGRRSGFQAVLP